MLSGLWVNVLEIVCYSFNEGVINRANLHFHLIFYPVHIHWCFTEGHFYPALFEGKYH
jgi:hypothetical protein